MKYDPSQPPTPEALAAMERQRAASRANVAEIKRKQQALDAETPQQRAARIAQQKERDEKAREHERNKATWLSKLDLDDAKGGRAKPVDFGEVRKWLDNTTSVSITINDKVISLSERELTIGEIALYAFGKEPEARIMFEVAYWKAGGRKAEGTLKGSVKNLQTVHVRAGTIIQIAEAVSL